MGSSDWPPCMQLWWGKRCCPFSPVPGAAFLQTPQLGCSQFRSHCTSCTRASTTLFIHQRSGGGPVEILRALPCSTSLCTTCSSSGAVLHGLDRIMGAPFRSAAAVCGVLIKNSYLSSYQSSHGLCFGEEIESQTHQIDRVFLTPPKHRRLKNLHYHLHPPQISHWPLSLWT